MLDDPTAASEPRPEAAGPLATGVPSLDRVLGGGLQPGSITMVVGAPGTGKSMLAQQISFHLARAGATTIYLTAFSEPHDKLLVHCRNLSFFDPAVIGEGIQFFSLADLLQEGADPTEAAVVSLAREHQARLVVLDGFGGMRRFLPDEQAVAHFLYALGTKLALLGATTLVNVAGDSDEAARYPELTVCDTILSLRLQTSGTRHRRLLEVVKQRGAMPLGGLHPFTIDAHGLTVYPRFESVVAPSASTDGDSDDRARFDLPALDTLLGGGLTRGTTTLVVGSPGTGKTLLGLHFLAAGARAQEPTLFLGFVEDVVQLRRKSRVFGLDLVEAEAAGLVRLLSLPGYDLEADAIADLISQDAARRGTRRLVLDSLTELERGLVAPDRAADFFSALVAYLRGRGIATYTTIDLPTIVGPQLQFADMPLSVLAENLLLLRYAEYGGQLHRLLSVLKMRFSDYDRTLYEYMITAGRGIELLGRPPEAVGLLTGLAQPLPAAWPAPPASAGGACGWLTILIVDDEEPIRELLALTLEESGHRILLANQGHQALELVACERPDLIIADVMMPVLNGRALCQQLKDDPKTRSIPVILMTAAGRQAASHVGADGYLAKPFNLDQVEALVHRWLLTAGTADGTDQA